MSEARIFPRYGRHPRSAESFLSIAFEHFNRFMASLMLARYFSEFFLLALRASRSVLGDAELPFDVEFLRIAKTLHTDGLAG